MAEVHAEASPAVRRRLFKRDRFTLKSDFDYMRANGRKFVTGDFLLICAEAPDGCLKCGIICSKKYSLNAVDRNRARRLFRESFRLLKPGIAPCRLLLIPRRRMMERKCPEVMAALHKVLLNCGVWKGDAGIVFPPSGA